MSLAQLILITYKICPVIVFPLAITCRPITMQFFSMSCYANAVPTPFATFFLHLLWQCAILITMNTFVWTEPYVEAPFAPVQPHQPPPDYSDHVRKQVFQALLMRSKNGKLGKQDTTIVGAQFGVKIPLVQRIWKQCKAQLAQKYLGRGY
jgi:hypothetical protein